MKKYVFCFFHFNNFFVTPGHIQAIFNFQDPILPELSHSQSRQHSRTYLQNLETNTETNFIVWQSQGNLIHFSKKCPNFVVFKDLKLSDGQTIIANPIFLEILKAVCLSFDWVPKLIQISFQTMEQKLAQRCETKVDGDACKASQGV